MRNLQSKVLGDDILVLTLLPPTAMDFPACIFKRQATYGIQQKNDYLKLCLANFSFYKKNVGCLRLQTFIL